MSGRKIVGILQMSEWRIEMALNFFATGKVFIQQVKCFNSSDFFFTWNELIYLWSWWGSWDPGWGKWRWWWQYQNHSCLRTADLSYFLMNLDWIPFLLFLSPFQFLNPAKDTNLKLFVFSPENGNFDIYSRYFLHNKDLLIKGNNGILLVCGYCAHYTWNNSRLSEATWLVIPAPQSDYKLETWTLGIRMNSHWIENIGSPFSSSLLIKIRYFIFREPSQSATAVVLYATIKISRWAQAFPSLFTLLHLLLCVLSYIHNLLLLATFDNQ